MVNDVHDRGIKTSVTQQGEVVKLRRHTAQDSGCRFGPSIFVIVTRSEKVLGVSIVVIAERSCVITLYVLIPEH